MKHEGWVYPAARVLSPISLITLIVLFTLPQELFAKTHIKGAIRKGVEEAVSIVPGGDSRVGRGIADKVKDWAEDDKKEEAKEKEDSKEDASGGDGDSGGEGDSGGDQKIVAVDPDIENQPLLAVDQVNCVAAQTGTEFVNHCRFTDLAGRTHDDISQLTFDFSTLTFHYVNEQGSITDLRLAAAALGFDALDIAADLLTAETDVSHNFSGLAPNDPLVLSFFNAFDAAKRANQDFERGDADNSGAVDINDGVYILSHLFLGSVPEPPCMDAADVNDDGRVTDTDAIYLLEAIILGSRVVPAPGINTAGADPTMDYLNCRK